ncbi:MAG: ribonuclease P protein subunit [Candidatus Bathyarchaeota archaeon]|nr:ribonuclease P protein subunit [Candidatus Bathyarchaeota archaeon]MDH5622933.1 ribonuclease P protein subunit [Candidatus Bathyarchaeota archaeon]MDH5635044.1 ribonuclease P protein subunit [Candidatus Bathyarchaeota archaeon]
MKVTPAIVQQELIGLNVKVVRSAHPGYVGIEGEVLDETRNTILILHKNKKKSVIKNTSVFDFTMQDGTLVEIDGKAIIGRPEVRVKKRVRRLW